MIDEIWKECRDLICCDAEGCDKIGPTNRCSRCQMVHYCSRECQKSDWKTHKHYCVPMEETRKEMAEKKDLGSKRTFDIEPDAATVERVLAEEETECGICLETSKNMKNPIVLIGCHHVFCFACLKHWNDSQTSPNLETMLRVGLDNLAEIPPSTPTCPICRQTIPNVTKATIHKVYHLLAEARLKQDSDPDQCAELCEQAIETIDLVVGGENPPIHQQYISTVIRGQAAILMKDYDEAVFLYSEFTDMVEDAVQRNDERNELERSMMMIWGVPGREVEFDVMLDEADQLEKEGCVTQSQHISLLLRLGEAQRLAKDWEDAMYTYETATMLYEETEESISPCQTREIYAGMSECAYQLGQYCVAISTGQYSVMINRHVPWCHKFLALAFKAHGDLVGARQWAADAVIYETPWDDKHVEEVKGWYKDNFREVVGRPGEAATASGPDVKLDDSTLEVKQSRSAKVENGAEEMSKSASEQLEPLFQKLLDVAERDPAQLSEVTSSLEELVAHCIQKADGS